MADIEELQKEITELKDKIQDLENEKEVLVTMCDEKDDEYKKFEEELELNKIDSEAQINSLTQDKENLQTIIEDLEKAKLESEEMQ